MTEDEPTLEMVVAVFSMPWKAKHALERVQQLGELGTVDLVDGAVMVKDSGGNLTISETLALTPKKGARRGAIAGGVIGVIFPPAILAAAAIGAAAGAAAGHFRDLGFADDYLTRLDEELAAGRSALMVVVDEADVDSVVDAMDDSLRIDRQPVRRS